MKEFVNEWLPLLATITGAISLPLIVKSITSAIKVGIVNSIKINKDNLNAIKDDLLKEVDNIKALSIMQVENLIAENEAKLLNGKDILNDDQLAIYREQINKLRGFLTELTHEKDI